MGTGLVTEPEFNTEGRTSMSDFPMAKFEKFIRNKIAQELKRQATYAMISNEYNFNDTAVRAKTYYHAAEIVRGESND